MALKTIKENNAFPTQTFYFARHCCGPRKTTTCASRAGSEGYAPRNVTAAAAQTATPLPWPAMLYLLQGPGRHAEGRTWPPAARFPSRQARGRGKGLGPCARALGTAGLGQQPEALTFSTKSVRYTAVQPPTTTTSSDTGIIAAAEAADEKRALASSSLRAATSQPNGAYNHSIRAGTNVLSAPFSRWRCFLPDAYGGTQTYGRAGTGKVCGACFCGALERRRPGFSFAAAANPVAISEALALPAVCSPFSLVLV